MSAKLLDGKLLAAHTKDALKEEIEVLKKKTRKTPSLVNIMIGEDAGAQAYANSQQKTAEYIGINYKLIALSVNASQAEILEQIAQLNKDTLVHGVMIHQPVPSKIQYDVVINSLNPLKDIEGMSTANLGKMILGQAKIIPCTPAAVMEHIKSTGEKIRGKEAVILGRSEIVGKPVSFLLLEQSATVTICHSGTSEAGKLIDHIKRADIVVAALGKPEFVKGEWIKNGAIVVDVGINKVGNQMIGDVEFEKAREKASYITPVPGGVGPVTVVMLMKNCLEAFKVQQGVR